MAIRKGAPHIGARWFNEDGTPTQEVFTFLTRGPFVSGELSLTNATRTAITHGLQLTPTRLQAFLVNKVTEYGVAVNRRVAVSSFEDANDYGVQISADATDIAYTIGANGIRIMREDAGNEGQFATVTNASWRLVIVADA